MRRLKGYESARVFSDQERLPAGGYVLKILDVAYQENIRGDVIILSFDIAEGDQKKFFERNYKNQTGEDKRWKGTYRIRVPKDDGSDEDEWTQRRFKTIMVNFEESNSGYHWDWDEKSLKGKMIGALFNNKEYDFNGRHGFYTNCHSLVSVEKIRSGKFQIPQDSLLKQDESPRVSVTNDDGFMNIPDGVEDEGLPFN